MGEIRGTLLEGMAFTLGLGDDLFRKNGDEGELGRPGTLWAVSVWNCPKHSEEQPGGAGRKRVRTKDGVESCGMLSSGRTWLLHAPVHSIKPVRSPAWRGRPQVPTPS